jgi:hypothetical protein
MEEIIFCCSPILHVDAITNMDVALTFLLKP